MYAGLLALQQAKKLSQVRFFGKVLGTGADYYVAEAKYESPPDPPEGDPPPPPPGAPVEESGTGSNEFVYFVANDPAAAWTVLPDVTPHAIVSSRPIYKFLTGNLSAEVRAYPPFPGKENEYLRALIARIVHGTTLTAVNKFKMPEEYEPGAMPAQNEDEDYKPTPTAKLGDVKGWCTRYYGLLQIGRTVNPPPPEEELAEGEPAFFATAEDSNELEDIVTAKQKGAEEGAGQLLTGATGKIHGGLKHGVLHIQRVTAILGEVAKLGVVSGLDLAALGGEHTREELQQGGLARTVGSDKDDELTALHFEVESSVNGQVTVGKVDVFHGNDALAGTLRLGEAKLDFLVLGDGSFDLFHSIDHFEFVLGTGGEIGFGFEAVGPVLHLRDFLLLILVGGDELFLARGLFPQVVVVVAFVAGDFGLGDLEDGVTQGVEENTVVGNEQNGAWIAGEIVLKPDEGLEVEVVGWLIQQEQVGFLD